MTQRVVAVTGAGGYVGGRLVETLVAAGHIVRAFTRSDSPWLAASTLHRDLCDVEPERLTEDLDGCDALVHLAGVSEVGFAQDPERAMTQTLVAARRVFSAAAEARVNRVVIVSTVHVYGAALRPDASVTPQLIPQPRAAYATARLAMECLGREFVGDAMVVLRLTNSVGAPASTDVDRRTLVVNDLARQAAETGRLVLRSHGMQWRDFVDLGDAAAVMAAATSPDFPTSTFDLASGRPATIRAVAQMVADSVEAATGRRPTLVAPDPPAATQPGPYVVDIAPLAELGVAPTTPLRASVDETVRWCLSAFGDSSRKGASVTSTVDRT